MADGFIRLDAALPELAGCTLFSLSQENEERIKRRKSPVLFFRANVLDDAEWMAIPYDVSWVHDVANDREWITYKAVCNGGRHDGRIVFELSISDSYIMQEYHADGTVPDAWMAFCNAFLPVYGVESGVVCTRLPDSDIEGNRGSMDFLMPKDVEKHLFLPMDYFESLRGEVRPVADEKPVDAPTVASDEPMAGKNTDATIERVLKVMAAYRSLREKGRNPSARALQDETERLFHRRVGKDVCLKVANSINEVLADLKDSKDSGLLF